MADTGAVSWYNRLTPQGREAAPRPTEKARPDVLEELIGEKVVVDLRSQFVCLGTLRRADALHLELEDADLHDLRDTRTTRENYVAAALATGIDDREAVPARRCPEVCLVHGRLTTTHILDATGDLVQLLVQSVHHGEPGLLHLRRSIREARRRPRRVNGAHGPAGPSEVAQPVHQAPGDLLRRPVVVE